MTRIPHQYQDPPWRASLWPVGFLFAALGHGLARFNDLTWGHAQLNPDATRMFLPIARRVASGVPLYGPGVGDNKPPAWHLLNVGAYLSGDYVVVMLIAVGIANGVTAILLWRLLHRADLSGLGVVAGALFLLVLPLVGGQHINSRPFMIAFVLVGFLAQRPAIRGSALAVGTLFNAYGAAFVVALLWITWRDPDVPQSAVVRYLTAGVTTVLVIFGAIAVIWNGDAVRGAVFWSFGLPVVDGVATSAVHPEAVEPGSYLASSWLLTDPLLWIHYTRTLVLQFLPLLLLAGIGWLYGDGILGDRRVRRVLDGGLLAAFVPLLFRGFEQYWLPVLPFLAVYATVGVVVLVTQSERRTVSA